MVFSVTTRGSTNWSRYSDPPAFVPVPESVAAERLAGDHRAGDRPVDVEVADRVRSTT